MSETGETSEILSDHKLQQMAKILGFVDLKCWQEAMAIAEDIYRISSEGPLSKDFGFRDHLRKTALSIPSNLAEGKERETANELVRFLYIAKGSTGELRTQLILAQRIGYFNRTEIDALHNRIANLSSMLGRLISTIKKRNAD